MVAGASSSSIIFFSGSVLHVSSVLERGPPRTGCGDSTRPRAVGQRFLRHGEAWLNFLDESCGGRDFREGPGRAIASAPYATADTGVDLAGAAKEWVRRHRADER